MSCTIHTTRSAGTVRTPEEHVLVDRVSAAARSFRRRNEWYVVTNDYAAAEQYYAIADQMWRETNPETACCDNLYKMAAQHGVFPKPASRMPKATPS